LRYRNKFNRSFPVFGRDRIGLSINGRVKHFFYAIKVAKNPPLWISPLGWISPLRRETKNQWIFNSWSCVKIKKLYSIAYKNWLKFIFIRKNI